MGVDKAHTWKELVEQVKIAEQSAQKFGPSTSENRWGFNNKSVQSSDIDTLIVEVSGETQSKKGNSNKTLEYQRQYSFRDKHVVTIFHLLKKGNKLKLQEARRSDEDKQMISTIVSFTG